MAKKQITIRMDEEILAEVEYIASRRTFLSTSKVINNIIKNVIALMDFRDLYSITDSTASQYNTTKLTFTNI